MALINQLVPESKPDATYLSPTNRTFNCQSALLAAHMHLDIPRIISYDGMLDLGKSNEMGMCFLTYLSYFVKPIGAALLSWVKKLVPSIPIESFENISTDGRYFLALMEACHPGCCPEWELLSAKDKKGNMEKALQVANTKLGIHIEMDKLHYKERMESKTLLFVAKIKASTTSKPLPVSQIGEKHGAVGECISQLLPTEYMGLNIDIEMTRLDEEIFHQIPLIEVSLNPESRQSFLEITFADAGYYGVTLQPSKRSFPFIVASLLQYTVRVKGSDTCGKSIGQGTHPPIYKYHFKVSPPKASSKGLTCTVEPTAFISTAMTSEPSGTHTDKSPVENQQNFDSANTTDATSNKALGHLTNLAQRNEMENGVANNENEGKFLTAGLSKIDPTETMCNEELNHQQESMYDEQEPGDSAASEEMNHMHEEHGGQEVLGSKESEVSESKESEVSESKESEVSESKESKVSESKESEVSESKESEVSESKESEMSESKESEVSESKESEMLESKESEVSESKESEVSESEESEVSESKESKVSESKESKVSESKESEISESKESEVSESKESEVSESKESEVSESKESEMSESKESEVSESKESEMLESKESEVSESEESEVSESKESEVSESEESEVSESKESKVSESKESKVSESKESEVSESKESEMLESKESEVSESKESKVSESKESKVSESEESKVSESKESEVSESKESEMSESKESEVSESKESEMLESKESEVSESKESKVSESKESKVSESEESKVSESKESEVSESKESEMSESKESEVSESKESKVSESKESKVSESEKSEVKKEGEYQDEFSQCRSSDDNKQDVKSEQSPMEDDTYLLTIEEGASDPKKANEVLQGMECPILDTHITVVGLSELKRVIVHKPITFQIHAHRAGFIENQTIRITIKPLEQVHGVNDSLSGVSVVHTDNGDGTYLVTCTIPSTGAYQVAILYKGKHVSESPYTLQAFSTASLCRAYGEVIEKSRRLMVGRQVRFYVDSTEACEGHIMVSVSDPALNEVKVLVTTKLHGGKQVHSIQFTPKTVGDHTATVEWDDTLIPGSPFQFKMVNPSKVQVHNLPTSSDCVLVVSQPFCFTINKSMAGEGEIKAISHLSDGGNEEFELQTSKNGYIIARYVPSRKGQMDLELTFVTVRILQHPWTCDIVDPASVTLSAGSLYCEKNKEFQFRISGLSDYETKYLTMNVIPPQGKSPLIHFDGIERANFTPVMAGEYFVTAQLAGESVNNSPLKVLAVSCSACRLGSSIPHHLALGREIDIEVNTSTAGPGFLTCTSQRLTGASTPETTENCIVVTTHNNLVRLKGVTTGKSAVSLKWAGFDVLSAPCKVTVVDPQECSFRFANSDANLQENTDISLHIDTTAADNCTPKVRLDDQNHDEIDVTIHHSNPGHYIASFHTTKCGTYTLCISVAEVDVKGSPTSFTVHPQPFNFEDIHRMIPTKLQVGKSVTIPMATPSVSVQSNVVCNPEESLEVSIQHSTEHHTDVTLTAKSVGKNSISFEIDGNVQNEEPFVVEVFDPTKCKVINKFPQRIHTGQQHTKEITIKTSEAGNEKLQVVSSNPSILCAELKQVDSDSHQLTLTGFDVAESPVSVDILFGDNSVPDCPFTVDTFDLDQVVIEPTDVPTTYINEPFTFTLYTKGAGVGAPEMISSNARDQAFQLDVTESESDVYSLCCTPLQIGTHSFSLWWDDLEAPFSPVTFSTFDPRQCVLKGLPPDGHIVQQQEITINVDCKKAGNGVITAEVEYGDKSTEQFIVQRKSNSASFTFTAATLGKTKLRVWFDRKLLLSRKWTAIKKGKLLGKRVCKWMLFILGFFILILTAVLYWYYFIYCQSCSLPSKQRPI